jgi:hypothetical protein
MYLQKVIKLVFCWDLEGQLRKIAGSGSISLRHGSKDPDLDPDPHQNVMDPKHWMSSAYSFQVMLLFQISFLSFVKGLQKICKMDPTTIEHRLIVGKIDSRYMK